MSEKGYIKFNCNWTKTGPIISDEELTKINEWRDELYNLGLIGVYPNGVGFGNISIRSKQAERFIITGSATGGLERLNEQHYSEVVYYDLERNHVSCIGPIKASSESLSHGVIYQTDPQTNGVVHVHNFDLWKGLMDKVPTTSKDVEYGTPEMGYEIIRLFKKTDVKDKKIFVMGGHEEGIITFGRDLNKAGKTLLDYFNKS